MVFVKVILVWGIFHIASAHRKKKRINGEANVAFLDLKKIFDGINRSLLWEILKIRGLSFHVINVVKRFYRGTVSYSDGQWK